jgi:hypothetical protein
VGKPEGEAFLFYFERWRGSKRVQRLSFAERGMFLEMMIEQWLRGDLPDNPEAVADAIALTESQVAEVKAAWPRLRQMYVSVEKAESRIQNLSLEQVRRERRAWLRKQQTLGRIGGKASAAKRLNPQPVDTQGPLERASTGPQRASTKELEGTREETTRKQQREIPRAHRGTVFEGALPREHVNHAFCGAATCVPALAHSKFLEPLTRAMAGDRQGAHQRLLAWYADVDKSLPESFVMGDAFKFWQPRFDATFASKDEAVSTITTKELDARTERVRERLKAEGAL